MAGENSDAVKEQKIMGYIKGIETEPTQPNELIEWQNRNDKAKSIIGLAVLDSELHCYTNLQKKSGKN
jgi:hypothetical protein